MTEVSGIPYIDEGLQAGIERASRHGLEPPDHLFEETVRVLSHVIESWPADLDEKFLVLFVENATVAAIARAHDGRYSPPYLDEDDLRAFLGHSAAFFNSFKHR